MHMLLFPDRCNRTKITLLRTAVICAVLAAFATPALAVDKYAAEFLKVGVGARAMGMGGSFVSLSNDASATYWNPAGLVQIGSTEALLMHASQFGGVVNHNSGIVSIPIGSSDKKNAAVAVTFIRLAVDDITVTKGAQIGTDPSGNPILNPDLFVTKSAYDLALLLSYASAVGNRWSWGLNLKLIRQSLVGEGASFGIGADLGVLYHAGPKWAFGARLADITTTQITWDTGRHEVVAPTVTVGAHTTQNLAALHGTLTLGVDASFAFQDYPGDQFNSSSFSGNFLPGMEYWLMKTFALRLGADGDNFTAGAGLRYKQVGGDYAYLTHDELDGTHRVSLLVRF
jgi:hypothetical protein